MSDSDSEREFLDRLNKGTPSAADEVNQRYWPDLCRLVGQLWGSRLRGKEDPEDIVQSVLCSFFRGVADGRFQIDYTGALWRLLEKITRRKILQHVGRYEPAKRDPGREVCHNGDRLVAGDPTPSQAAVLAEVIENVLDGLEPVDSEIFQLRLQGHTQAEIAKKLELKRGVVRYKLDRIKDRLSRLLETDSGE